MFKILFSLLLLLNILPALAYYMPNGNTLYSNNFNSRLKMNQPKTIITSSTTSTLPHYRNRNYSQQFHPNYYTANTYLPKQSLNALEKYALNKTYRSESDLQRLERLENLAFGAIQYGNPIDRYKNVENAILSRPQYNTKQSLLNNVANYFSGRATGFTPPIYAYPNYANLGGFTQNPYMFKPNYSNTNYEQYSNGIFGGGWGFSGNDFGTGSSVKILD